MMDGLVVPLDESALIARARGLFMPAAIAVYKGALNAQSDLGSAAAILDRAGAIARDAVALARPHARGTVPRPVNGDDVWLV